jgi:hypothetical protein
LGAGFGFGSGSGSAFGAGFAAGAAATLGATGLGVAKGFGAGLAGGLCIATGGCSARWSGRIVTVRTTWSGGGATGTASSPLPGPSRIAGAMTTSARINTAAPTMRSRSWRSITDLETPGLQYKTFGD